MLEDVAGIRKVVLACGTVDLRKGLLWMGTGFLLLYKRFEYGRLSWPSTTQEAAELTEEQFHYLMIGLNPLKPKIKDVEPHRISWWLCKTGKFFFCFFTYISIPGWHISMPHRENRDGIYAFQNKKINLENSIFPCSVKSFCKAGACSRMTKSCLRGIRFLSGFVP